MTSAAEYIKEKQYINNFYPFMFCGVVMKKVIHEKKIKKNTMVPYNHVPI